MIARQNRNQRLLGDQLVREARLLLAAHKRDVELPALERVGEHGRMVARDPDLDVEQLVAQKARGEGQPFDFLPGEESDGEGRLGGLGGAPCRLRRRFGLGEREPRMVEEGAAGGGERDAVDAARQERNADFIFEIADLPAQRRLRGVQPLLGGDREAALLGDRDEIAKVAQLHNAIPCLPGMVLSLQSLFHARQSGLLVLSTLKFLATPPVPNWEPMLGG